MVGVFANLSASWSVTWAATLAGYTRSTACLYRAAAPTFAVAWDDAYEAGSDWLEDELQRRSHDGWDEPVFYKGEVCGHVRQFSDTLLLLAWSSRYRRLNVVFDREPDLFAAHVWIAVISITGTPARRPIPSTARDLIAYNFLDEGGGQQDCLTISAAPK